MKCHNTSYSMFSQSCFNKEAHIRLILLTPVHSIINPPACSNVPGTSLASTSILFLFEKRPLCDNPMRVGVQYSVLHTFYPPKLPWIQQGPVNEALHGRAKSLSTNCNVISPTSPLRAGIRMPWRQSIFNSEQRYICIFKEWICVIHTTYFCKQNVYERYENLKEA